MKIGITGANGFIGRHLVNHLSKNFEIIAFDSSEGFETSNVEWRIKDLSQCTREDFLGVDKLIHLAGSATDKDAFQRNFELTKKVVSSCIEAGVKYIYLASSFSVYGHRDTPADSDSELKPSGDYANSKVLAERVVKEAILNGDIKGSIFRFCSIYGKGGKGLIDIIKNKIKAKEKIQLNSLFTRNYLYVEDLCKLIEDFVNIDEPDLIYNITGEKLSSKELFEFLKLLDVNCEFSDIKAVSYLSSGITVLMGMDVKTYLKQAL